MTDIELKPCPFCGSAARPALENDEWVECSNSSCDAMQSGAVGGDTIPAAAAWNRRSPMKMLVDAAWLTRRVESDPDENCEVRPAQSALAAQPAPVEPEGITEKEAREMAEAQHDGCFLSEEPWADLSPNDQHQLTQGMIRAFTKLPARFKGAR